jgi:hypothetical protein
MGAGDIDEALYLIMSGDTTLAAYFSTPLTQILYGDDQKYKNTPRVVFEKISDPSKSQMPEKWQRWGFNITHTNFLEAEAIQSRIVYLFSDGSGDKGSVTINNASIIDRGRTPYWEQAISAFKTRVDVRISYL